MISPVEILPYLVFQHAVISEALYYDTNFNAFNVFFKILLKSSKENAQSKDWAFRSREPDDDLLSHGNPHYHWRRGVSLSCSGWEGVEPPRYGRQAKLFIFLTFFGQEDQFIELISFIDLTNLAPLLWW